jgi:ubiquinone/menaquinone biosynthesis C-methylase UbiE
MTMVKPRISETDEGIQEEFEVQIYDKMQQRFRDKGWMETDAIIKSGINKGMALEVGPGPGYLGLEWLKKTNGTSLIGIEISPEMIKIADQNAKEYGLEHRVEYVRSDAAHIPFEDDHFDGVFANGSLHEWAQPQSIFDEIYRVLKHGGRHFISDLRRDINPLLRWFMYAMTKPKEIRPGFMSSVNAAYTVDEIQGLLEQTELKDAMVSKTIIGLEIKGMKMKEIK